MFINEILEDAQELLDDMSCLTRKKSLETAETKFREALNLILEETGDQHLSALCGRYLSLGYLGRFDEAEQIFQELKDTYPNEALFHHNRGIVNRKKGNLEDAIGNFSTAIELDPECPSYAYRGFLNIELGNFDDALKDFNKLIELFSFALPYNNRGSVYLVLKEYDKAILDFDKALEFEEDDVSITAYGFRGDCYRLKGDSANAVRDYESVLELFNSKSSENKTLIDHIAAIRAERRLLKLDKYDEQSIESEAVIDEIVTPETLDRFFKHYT